MNNLSSDNLYFIYVDRIIDFFYCLEREEKRLERTTNYIVKNSEAILPVELIAD